MVFVSILFSFELSQDSSLKRMMIASRNIPDEDDNLPILKVKFPFCFLPEELDQAPVYENI